RQRDRRAGRRGGRGRLSQQALLDPDAAKARRRRRKANRLAAESGAEHALSAAAVFAPWGRVGFLLRVRRQRARAAGLLQSSEHHGGGTRRNCRRQALQRTVGLLVCPLFLPAMLDIAYGPVVLRMDDLQAAFRAAATPPMIRVVASF